MRSPEAPSQGATLPALLGACDARLPLIAPSHDGALRLVSGHAEGAPGLTLELYGRTLVFIDHGKGAHRPLCEAAIAPLRERLPFVKAALFKAHRAPDEARRRGDMLLGASEDLDTSVTEHGVTYALDLSLHQDTTLYLDTRELRALLRSSLSGKTALNTFAYTGALGVACRAAPARRVVDTDRSRPFLDVARRSCAYNGFAVAKGDLIACDFFDITARFRREGRLFDWVIVDPPFFSQTGRGRVDLEAEIGRLVAKVRPLVAHGGRLVFVDNALYLPGASLTAQLEALCADGYMSIERRIPVPDDCVGLRLDPSLRPPADPSPYNHPTKITVLEVRRKDERPASP